MKKYIMVLMIVSLTFLGASTLKANTEVAFQMKHFPKGINYISMDNLDVSGSSDITMLHPIRVKPNTTYTLIMSEAAVGQSFSYADGYETRFHLPGSHEGISLYGTYTSDDLHVYYTFTTLPHMQFLMITDFMCQGMNDEIMLYEGTIDDFSGYVLYEGPDMSYGDYPTFSNNGVYLVNVDYPVSAQVIQSSLMAYDNVDGDLTNQIVILEDNYTAYKHIIGDHTLVFSVTDSSNNQTTFTLLVRVVDITPPIIDGVAHIVSKLSEPELTAESIKTQLTAQDNVDGDISSQIDILHNPFDGNGRIPGTYAIVYHVMDAYGNSSQKTVTVEVKDDIAPIFTGPTRIDVFLSEEKVTSEAIKEMMAAHDNIDGVITERIHVISNPFLSHERVPGEYDIVFGVSDLSGNHATRVVKVVVKDDVAPIIWVDHLVIPKTMADALTLEDIKLIFLRALEGQGILAYDVSVISDEYTGNESDLGFHYIHLSYKTLSGEVHHERVKVAVVESFPTQNQTDYTKAIYAGSVILLVLGCACFIHKRK